MNTDCPCPSCSALRAALDAADTAARERDRALEEIKRLEAEMGLP